MPLLTAAVNAYVALLRLSTAQRIHVNGEMCGLRDAIADFTGRDPESVQDECTELAHNQDRT